MINLCMINNAVFSSLSSSRLYEFINKQLFLNMIFVLTRRNIYLICLFIT